MSNLPFAVFKDVHEGVTSLNLGTSGTHGEFVKTNVLAPVDTNGGMAFQDNTLGLHLQKVVEVVLDGGVVSTGSVRDGGQQYSLLSVTLGNGVRVH